jgi:hypothetical protein
MALIINSSSKIRLTNFHKIYILQSSIINHPGGGAGISSFSGNKDWRPKETFVKYRQSEE